MNGLNVIYLICSVISLCLQQCTTLNDDLVWSYYDTMNSNYFLQNGGLASIYADTNELIAPQGKIIFSVYFRKKGDNRIAPVIVCGNPDGTNIQEIKNDDMNGNYFPTQGSGLANFYADANPLFVPDGKIWIGFTFVQIENRLAPAIYCSNSDGSDAQWIQTKVGTNNYNYFPKEPGLQIFYADTNVLVSIKPPRGFVFYAKHNRLTPMLLSEQTNTTNTTNDIKQISFYSLYSRMACYTLTNKWYDVNLIPYIEMPWSVNTWQAAVGGEFILKYLQNATDYQYEGRNKSGGLYLSTIVLNNVVNTKAFFGAATDDYLWFIIAHIEAYKYTYDQNFLKKARSILDDKDTPYWSLKCRGGLWWDFKKTYKSAISNELFFYASSALYLIQRESILLDYAYAEWNWFSNTGLINDVYLINDGLDANCSNNGQTTWTYNQGVILGGLTNMYLVTGDTSFINLAFNITKAVIDKLAPNGVLKEPTNNPDGDQLLFKGIFMNYLTYYMTYEPDYAKRLTIGNFILNNARSVVQKAINTEGLVNFYWNNESNPIYSSATLLSAIGLFNAASKVNCCKL